MSRFEKEFSRRISRIFPKANAIRIFGEYSVDINPYLMLNRKLTLLLLVCALLPAVVSGQTPDLKRTRSYEGMWLPLKIKELNYTDMKAVGVELTAEEMYNEAAPSVKDAIVRLNDGSCTAEIISGEGLMLTNHHCAYDGVASLSTPEKDYLTNGYWAMSRAEELPIEGATAAFLIHSQDVTAEILASEDPETKMEELVTKATEGTTYTAEVKEMFNGLEYYLFVYERFTDVRLVGVPPSAIGKFGGDTDNWMWPRHTADFTILRVYAGADNKPAAYSAQNVPYKPKHFLPVSLKGVKENDYAMVMGYPGSTDRYLSSSAVALALDQSNADKINLFGIKTEVMKAAMDKDNAVRLAMAGDYASLMNTYKYFIGQTTMLGRYNIVGVKEEGEKAFQVWADADPARKEKYGSVLGDTKKLYDRYRPTDKFMNYLFYGTFFADANGMSFQLNGMKGAMASGEAAATQEVAAELRAASEEYFSKFNYEVDKEIFVRTFLRFYEDMPAELRPTIFDEVLNGKPVAVAEETGKKAKKKKKEVVTMPVPVSPELPLEARVRAWAEKAYATSIATDRGRMEAFLSNPTQAALDNDPLYGFISGVIGFYRSKVALSYVTFNRQSAELSKTYLAGLREMHPEKSFYPDANSTMRLTYGKVLPYSPRDGAFYNYFTTLEGVIEKEDPKNPEEFTVPAKLKQLYLAKDYGRYNVNGTVPVNFLTTNDITGGNSGSPVINSKGELIGCAFDGNWEAMAGDIYVFPNLNRTICVDIRYVLFIVDKFAGAGHLLKEMKIAE
ncbi:MAG: S46 family peptidase [Bacteroidetes bacterium]|nr:MAG: S46 family peptidase [Bacteroidota bacterium]